MDIMRGNPSFRVRLASSGLELLALYLTFHSLSAELFIDVHAPTDDTHDDNAVIFIWCRKSGEFQRLHCEAPGARLERSRPMKGNQLIELVVDPGENLFTGKRTALFDI